MTEPERDHPPADKDQPQAPPADEGKKPPRAPLAERLREKLERIRKDDRNVYPLY